MVAYGRRREVVTLMNFLEKDVTSTQNLPSSQLPTAYLGNSMALIQMVKAAGSSTFGVLSQKYEAIVTSTFRKNGCTRVDLIFDQHRPLRQGRRAKQARSKLLGSQYPQWIFEQIHVKCVPWIQPRFHDTIGF